MPGAARAPVRAAGRGKRRCSSPEATASRLSVSWARSCGDRARARLFYGGRRRPICLLPRFGRPRRDRGPGHRGRQHRRARPRDGTARGAPRGDDAGRCGSTPAAPTRCCTPSPGSPPPGPRRGGEPRPLDGLRRRDVPGVRRPHPAGGRARPKYRCACTDGPVFDARRCVWPGQASGAARPATERGPRVKLAVEIGGLHLKNPVLAASGTFGYGVEYDGDLDLSHLGGIVVEGPLPRAARRHPTPRIVETPVRPAERHRAAGRRHPRLRARRAAAPARATTPRVVVNVCGDTVEEYAEVAAHRDDAPGVPASRSTSPAPTSSRAAWPSAATRG